MREVSADMGYSSYDNHDAILKSGATPFIAFKSNTKARQGGLFEKMFHYFSYRREEFLRHYHKRSNVESTFSMMKAKFGDGIRSKTDVAMKNEALAKVLCHNLVVLIHEMYELGIDPAFWGKEWTRRIICAESRPAQRMTPPDPPLSKAYKRVCRRGTWEGVQGIARGQQIREANGK